MINPDGSIISNECDIARPFVETGPVLVTFSSSTKRLKNLLECLGEPITDSSLSEFLSHGEKTNCLFDGENWTAYIRNSDDSFMTAHLCK